MKITTIACLLGSSSVVHVVQSFAPSSQFSIHRHLHHSTTRRWGETVTTDSGLKYEDTLVGDGSSPGSNDFVSVHYDGYLPSGKVFDSSRPKNPKDDLRSTMQQGKPLQFPLGRGKIIPGWEEGVKGMRVGGKRTLIIPSDLAYGTTGTPDGVVKPGDQLTFDVELISINGNMSVTGALGISFLTALGIIAVNGIFLLITGHELREYLNAAING